MGYYKEKTPRWVTAIILLLMTPLLLYPLLLSGAPADSAVRMLIWFYPAYVIAAGVCAWMCYPQRPEVAWVLIVLLVLTHAAMFYLRYLGL